MNKKKYIFGPVPSRRLGLSLGVDLVPYKTCSLDCIYCECGATTNLTVERKEYVPINEVIKELDFELKNNPNINFVTFSGSGEPTLHSKIKEVIDFIKNNYKNLKICLLTNSTLLNDKGLCEEIMDIDLIVPSLDSVDICEFRKINRPENLIKIDEIINGIAYFKKISKTKMWLEILVMPNINDSIESFEKLREPLLKIKPDKVQLNTLDRPGCFDDLNPVSKEKLEELASVISDITTVEIVAKFAYKKKKSSAKIADENIEDKILEFISRRPCTIDDILYSLDLDKDILKANLFKLEKYNKISTKTSNRGIFYSVKS